MADVLVQSNAEFRYVETAGVVRSARYPRLNQQIGSCSGSDNHSVPQLVVSRRVHIDREEAEQDSNHEYMDDNHGVPSQESRFPESGEDLLWGKVIPFPVRLRPAKQRAQPQWNREPPMLRSHLRPSSTPQKLLVVRPRPVLR